MRGLTNSIEKDGSNRNNSCLVNQSPSPVGVGTNQKSSSDITDDITGKGKVFIAGAPMLLLADQLLFLLAVVPVAMQQEQSHLDMNQLQVKRKLQTL